MVDLLILDSHLSANRQSEDRLYCLLPFKCESDYIAKYHFNVSQKSEDRSYKITTENTEFYHENVVKYIPDCHLYHRYRGVPMVNR